MLSDLGLHERVGSSVSLRATHDLSVERNMAYGLLSACIVYEGVWTLYLGRPSSIPKSAMDAAQLGWEDAGSHSPWLNAWVALCIPMAQISHVLNDQSINEADKTASLRELHKKIEEWHDGLPAPLMYDENRLTDMDLPGYGLHSQYCKVQIFLQQGLRRGSLNWRKRTHAQLADESTALQASPDDSDAVIYQYALRIARLVVTYREAFGLEEIPSIMLDNAVVSATVMIQHLNKTSNANEVQHRSLWLRQLVRSLESMQPHYPIISRMLDSLRQICGSGPLKGIFQSQRREAVLGGAPHATKPFTTSNSLLPLDYTSSQFGTTAAPAYPLAAGFLDDAWGFNMDSAIGVFPSARFDDGALQFL